MIWLLYILPLEWSPCPHSILIVGLWCPILQTDATGTLDSLPLILGDNFTQCNNPPRSPCPPSNITLPPYLEHSYTLSSSSGLPSVSSRRWVLRTPSAAVNLHWMATCLPPDWIPADAWLDTPDCLPDVPAPESLPRSTCAAGSTWKWGGVGDVLAGDGTPLPP